VTPFTFSICLAWEAPADNGGQDINGYRIEIWDMNEYELENFTLVTTVGSNMLTYSIDPLDNDTDYRYVNTIVILSISGLIVTIHVGTLILQYCL